MTKSTNKRKKQIKWTKKLARFICDEISSGLNVAEIKKKYPDKVPDTATIYRKRTSDPEFKEQYETAYTSYIMYMMDEYSVLSKALASEVYPGVDFREAEAALKRRVDNLKFTIAKTSAMLTRAFDKAQVVEHTGSVEQITIQNYCLPDIETKDSKERKH